VLDLVDINDLALKFCPEVASWQILGRGVHHYGPAHELAHALLSTPSERRLTSYGLCELANDPAYGYPVGCSCDGARCFVVELAAMTLSRGLVSGAGHPEIAEDEARATLHYRAFSQDREVREAADLLLERRGLAGKARSRADLLSWIRRRRLVAACGRVAGDKRRDRAAREVSLEIDRIRERNGLPPLFASVGLP
jgi:hypothetical protein